MTLEAERRYHSTFASDISFRRKQGIKTTEEGKLECQSLGRVLGNDRNLGTVNITGWRQLSRFWRNAI